MAGVLFLFGLTQGGLVAGAAAPTTWIALAALLLFLPGPFRRLLFELAGGFTLLVLLLPLLAAGLGLLAWQFYRRRFHTCANCGMVSFGASQCPACGADLDSRDVGMGIGSNGDELDASDVTINVSAVDVGSSPNSKSSKSDP
jgi:hypothetical protein